MPTPLKDIQPLVDYWFQRPRSLFFKNAIGASLFVQQASGSDPKPYSIYNGHVSYGKAQPPNAAVFAGSLNLAAAHSQIHVTSTPILITLSDPITLSTFSLNPIFPGGIGDYFTTDALAPDTQSLPHLQVTFSWEDINYYLTLWETTVLNEFKIIESASKAFRVMQKAAASS